MKKWEMPRIEAEQFEANEYVAACGDGGKVYNFKCDAGPTYTYTKTYWTLLGPFEEEKTSNYYDVKDSSGKVRWRSYHPCGKTHKATDNNDFLTGYHLDNPHTPEDENISVIVWTDRGTNCHCTTNLDMDSWTLARS